MPFRDVIGHRRLVALLARSIGRDRLPPSLIFSGPDGVGKRLVAVATAQALNCPSVRQPDLERTRDTSDPAFAVELDACGTCAVCRRIARGVHPDVLLLEPGDSGSIKIEQVREVIDSSYYRPFEGRRRAVIIDEADALVPAAQNALLKTLEEPPPSSVFMLVTSRPDLLLPTVRSRCPQLRFRTLSASDVAMALVKRGRSEEEARAVAAVAGGSIRQALDASGDDHMGARGVAVTVLTQAAATPDPRRRIEAAKDLLAKTGAGGASDREQVAVHLRAISSLLRDIEAIGAGADGTVLANADVRPILERLTAFRGERGVRAFEAVDTALAALDRNAGVKVVADWLVLQL